MKTLEELFQERILILDAAMGTMIQRYKLDEVGADILETNTFN